MDLSYPPSFRVSVCQCSYPLLKRTFSDVEGVSECRETASCHLFPPASGARFFPRLLLTCLFQHWRYGAWGLPGKCSASEPHPDRALRSVLCGFTLNNQDYIFPSLHILYDKSWMCKSPADLHLHGFQSLLILVWQCCNESSWVHLSFLARINCYIRLAVERCVHLQLRNALRDFSLMLVFMRLPGGFWSRPSCLSRGASDFTYFNCDLCQSAQ